MIAMRRMVPLDVIFLLPCLLIFSVYAQPADTPWPMFRYNARHTGVSSYAGPLTPMLRWSYRTGDWVESSPSIGNGGDLYVGSDDGCLYSIRSDGALSWSYNAGYDVIPSPAIGIDGRIYFGSACQNMYAIDSDGTFAWSYRGAVCWMDSSPVLGDNGEVCFSSSDNNLYILNSDGSLSWSYKTGAWMESSPAIESDGSIYVGANDSKLYAFSSAGTLKWTYTTVHNGAGRVWSSPSIGSNGSIYIGPRNDMDHYLCYFHVLNSDGSMGWTYRTGWIEYSSAAVWHDGSIYVGSSDNILFV